MAQSNPLSPTIAKNVPNHSHQAPSSSVTPNSSTTLPSSARAAKPMLALTTSSATGTKLPSSHVRIVRDTRAQMHFPAKIISLNIFGHTIVSITQETTKVTVTVIVYSFSALGPTALTSNVRLGLGANTQNICVASTTTLLSRALCRAV